MKPKTTIILVVLVVVCIALALFTSDLFTPRKPEEGEALKQDLFEPAPGKCVKLAIEGKNGSFVFEKVGDAWRIAEPISAKAENWRVDDVADAFKDLEGRPVEDVGDETTGLDKPIWTVTATDDKKKAHTLLVGRPRPMKSNQTYVRPAGSKKTFVAEVDFAYKLDKRLSDFRDETVLDLKSDKIARLTVTGKESYELVKKDGKWSLVKPISAPADSDEVKKLLDKVARVTASEFVTDAPKDLAPYGLEKPQLIAEMEMAPEKPKDDPATKPATKPAKPPKPGKKHGLAIGKRVGDKLYAKLTGEPTVFKVDGSTLKDLQPDLVTLRVKKVMRIAADDVTAVELETAAGKASLAKKDDAWRMTAPLKGPADKDAVKKLLDAIADLKAESFKDGVAAPGVYGFDKPSAKITLRLAGKDQTATLLIGGKSPSREMTFVKSAAGLAVAVVKTADVKGLLAEPATYWDRTILKLPEAAKVTRLELRRTDATFTLAPKDAGSADWSLSTPLAAKADKDQVNKVIDHVEDLQADKVVYLGTRVPDSFAKSKDIMQVLVTASQAPPEAATKPATKPTTKPTKPTTQSTQPAATRPAATQPAKPAPKPVVTTHQITVVKTGMHSYAWAKGGKVLAVGEFAPSLYDDLAAELRSKALWTIDPEKVRGLSLLAGADSLVLKKDGEKWTYAADTYVKIDATKVADFLKDIKEPKVKKFATHKAPSDLAKFGLDKPWLKLELIDDKGLKTTVTVSHTGPTKAKDRYGMGSSVEGVFVLPASTVEKLGKKLKDFKK